MPDDLHERIKKIAQKTGTDVKSLINMTMKDLADNEEGLSTLTKQIESLEKEVFKNRNLEYNGTALLTKY